MRKSFDFVIVGGGTAGCVLANRLSENADHKVLLLEAGQKQRSLLIKVPLAFPRLRDKAGINWYYNTEPEPSANGRSIALRQGRIWGGSSSINGMLYHRGHSADYDEWQALGLHGWGYAEVLPYFIKAENSWRGKNDFHGDSGPIAVSTRPPKSLLAASLQIAFQSLGLPLSEDLHALQQIGLATGEFMIGAGRRADTASCYLLPAKDRKNLTISSGSTALRLLLEKDRAVGVEFERGGQVMCAAASVELIVCCGAYKTPQLLMLSGIGPAEDLRLMGGNASHDLPGVGRNLQVHANIATNFAAKKPVGFYDELRADRLAVSALRWLLWRSGSMASLPIECTAMLKTDASHARPDILSGYAGGSMDQQPWFPGFGKGKGHRICVINALLHPVSRGRVLLGSQNPKDPPRISFNLLAEPEDRLALIRSIDIQREVFGASPLAAMITKELTPGSSIKTSVALQEHLRANAGASQHPVGTCAMGVGPNAVVDSQLRVIGLRGLRIVDASVMPLIVGAGTCAPTIMVAEKAADMVLGASMTLKAQVQFPTNYPHGG